MKVDLVRHPKIGDIGIEIQIWEGHPIYSLTIEEAEMLSVMLMETIPLAGDAVLSDNDNCPACDGTGDSTSGNLDYFGPAPCHKCSGTGERDKS
jgi:hypothetical protein